MILDLDIGNTRLKWRLIEAESGTFEHGSMALREWPAGLELARVQRARVSNVAGVKVEHLILESLNQVARVRAEFARSLPRVGQVTNGYLEPERLGVDRWLAVLAGFHQTGGPCCVVDCGSAITVDYVNGQGQHLGGLIAPGLALMRKALLEGTSSIAIHAEVEEPPFVFPRGIATEQAVKLGLRYMEVGLIELAHLRFGRAHGDSRLLLTGGDSEVVSSLLECSHVVLPHLVLDGLAIAMP